MAGQAGATCHLGKGGHPKALMWSRDATVYSRGAWGRKGPWGSPETRSPVVHIRPQCGPWQGGGSTGQMMVGVQDLPPAGCMCSSLNFCLFICWLGVGVPNTASPSERPPVLVPVPSLTRTAFISGHESRPFSPKNELPLGGPCGDSRRHLSRKCLLCLLPVTLGVLQAFKYQGCAVSRVLFLRHPHRALSVASHLLRLLWPLQDQSPKAWVS